MFSPIKGIVEYSDSERVWVARVEVNDLRDNEMKSYIRAVAGETSS